MNEKERQELLSLLNVPMFNLDEHLLLLFEYFLEATQPKKEEWFSSILPDQTFDDLFVRRLLSELNKKIEQYFIWKQLENREGIKSLLLLSAYRERRLYRHFDGLKRRKTKPDLFEYASDSFFYEYQYLAEEDKKTTEMGLRIPKTNTAENLLQLDLFYITEKLRFFYEIDNSKHIIETDDLIHLRDETIQLAQSPPFNEYVQIQLYLKILDTLPPISSDVAFKESKELFIKNLSLFGDREKRFFYLALINFWIRKINKGVPDALRQCFQLYQEMEKQGLLVQGEHITPWSYKNIITAALLLNEVNWAQRFITKYKDALREEHRTDAFYFNSAKLNFALKKYGKVLSNLQKVEHEDIFYGLDSRILLMKSYYYTHEIEALLSLTDSFRIYLKRKRKIPDERKKRYLTLIRFIRNYFHTNPRDLARFKRLKKNIAASPKFIEKNWLTEIVEKKIKEVEKLYNK